MHGSGLQNVTFFDEGPSCIRDKGQTTLTDITRMECSNCGEHLGGEIVRIIIPYREYILYFFYFITMYSVFIYMYICIIF